MQIKYIHKMSWEDLKIILHYLVYHQKEKWISFLKLMVLIRFQPESALAELHQEDMMGQR